MATPVMLKKIDEKKLAAQKRREKQQQDHLLPLGGMSNAPSDHLLIRENPNPVPRMIDLQPLSSQFTQYRQRKTTDFAVDRPIGLNYTSFETNSGSGTSNFDYQELYQPQPYIQQPNYHTNSYGYNKPMSLQKGNFNRKTKMQILEPPADMNTVEYTIRANNLVCFHGKTHFLSSLYREDITIDGHTYLSVEHYYQACKVFTLLGPTQAQMLRGEQDSLKVKNKAKQILQSNGVNIVTIDQWKNTKGLLVLLHGTRHKFNNVELRKKLMATGDALLCQAYDRADNLYAVGMSEQELREWASENERKVLKVPAELTEDEVKYLPLIGKGKNILGIICMQVRNEIRDKKENVGPTEEVTGDKKAQEESRGSSPKTSSDGTKDEETGLGVVEEEDDATKLAQEIGAALYAGFGEEPISTPKK